MKREYAARGRRLVGVEPRFYVFYEHKNVFLCSWVNRWGFIAPESLNSARVGNQSTGWETGVVRTVQIVEYYIWIIR